MKVILYARDFSALESLQRYKSSGVPVELHNKAISTESIQVIIDLDEYRLSPTNTENEYLCYPLTNKSV